jgi:hypothetical protein
VGEREGRGCVGDAGEDSPGLEGVAEDTDMWLERWWDRNGEARGRSHSHTTSSPSLGRAADRVVRLAWYGRTSTADMSISGIAHTKCNSVHPNRPLSPPAAQSAAPLPSRVITGGGLHVLTVPLACNTQQHTHTTHSAVTFALHRLQLPHIPEPKPCSRPSALIRRAQHSETPPAANPVVPVHSRGICTHNDSL